MRISNIQSGSKFTLEIETENRGSFGGEPPISIQNEVVFVRDPLNDNILLTQGSDTWRIRGKDQDNQTLLEKILDRNLPLLCWTLETKPKGKSPTQLKIQVHEFPSRIYISEEIQFGIDEKIIQDIRKRYLQNSAPVEKIVEWLNGQLLIPPMKEGGEIRALMRTSPNYQDGLENSFQLCGNKITANLCRTEEGRLRVERIIQSRSSKNINEQRPIILLEGFMSFCDASVAGTLKGTIRTELDILSKNADSYLSLWRDYNELESQAILKKAKNFNWVSYSSSERLANGDYRFYLDPQKYLQEQLQGLRELSELSLEASQTPPDLSDFEVANKNNKVFFGQVVDFNAKNVTLDIRTSAPDEQLSPPSRGFLSVSLLGDRTRLKRRQRAEALIRTASCPLPQLGLILQNQKVPISNYRNNKLTSKLIKSAFAGTPTTRQIEALNVAINTPDIALIQGPPGTGKTKVITAILVAIAEIEKNKHGNVSHRLLLTSYQHDAVENAAERISVFGLPAVRVGGKANRSTVSDNVDRWRQERIDALEAKLAQWEELPETALLRKVHNLLTAYVLSPGNLQKTAQLLQEVYDLSKGKIPGELSDRLLLQCRSLIANRGHRASLNNQNNDLLIQAIRSLRTEPISFADDGPRNAGKALGRLEPLNLLSGREVKLLKIAFDWDSSEASDEPPFLQELADLQNRLLERLISVNDEVDNTAIVNPEIESLLIEVREALTKQVEQSNCGVQAVLEEYLNDLRSDPKAVRTMLKNYTVVLAATCQQAVGREMDSTTENVNSIFETVIIDEAARANPLDLFIPMAKAERRIVLVGDHRQLPHILEEDIERQLSFSNGATQEALRKSLFERLFKQLQEWEKRDGIKRTVTLDTQYRMHPILGDFVSRTFYEYHGEAPIRAGRPEKEFIHNLPGYEDRVAAWIDIPFALESETGGQSKYRPLEAKTIARELKKLIEYDTCLTFGVIAFYRAQITELWKALCEVGLAEESDDEGYQVSRAWRETVNHSGKIVERLRIGTVDAFQGKEFDVVFLSLTRSNNIQADYRKPENYRKKYGFLLLENRLCVAMSRQQRLLIIVGDLDMIRAEADKPEEDRQAIRELISFYELCQTPQGKII